MGVGGVGVWGFEMMWGPSRQCDNGGDVGMTGTTWGQWGQHRVETLETTETTAMGTTWGPSGGYGNDVGMTGQCGDDVGMTRTMWGPRGDNEITKNGITLEQIEIIEFCLKIWDP